MKEQLMLRIRENLLSSGIFTEFKTEHFAGYAGAEKFLNGASPLICSMESMEVIFDANGISFQGELESVDFTPSSYLNNATGEYTAFSKL